MSYVKNNSYREIPFCAETRQDEFYTYIALKDLSDKCESQVDAIRCRTLGILQSLNGRFYLNDFDSSGTNSKLCVQVSVVYLRMPLQSTLMPYPVQIFGTLQWKNRPVVFAKLLQVLTIPTAIRLKSALNGIISTHLANSSRTLQGDEIEDPS